MTRIPKPPLGARLRADGKYALKMQFHLGPDAGSKKFRGFLWRDETLVFSPDGDLLCVERPWKKGKRK